jgi:DNA-binding transcriptional LysR family regulator
LESLIRRSIDIGIVFAPFEPMPCVEYLRLGSVEPVVAVPSTHRLAAFDRIPRSELLGEKVFTLSRAALNRPLANHLRASFFDGTKHDDLVEIADVTEALVRVAAGEGITMTNPMFAELDISNVSFRRLEDPVPELEYGAVWLEASTVPFVPDFVELARELSATANN